MVEYLRNNTAKVDKVDQRVPDCNDNFKQMYSGSKPSFLFSAYQAAICTFRIPQELDSVGLRAHFATSFVASHFVAMTRTPD